MAKGLTLRAARVNANLTQKELADRLGVDRTTIVAWENGNTKIKTAYLIAFCEVCGVSTDDIVLPTKST